MSKHFNYKKTFKDVEVEKVYRISQKSTSEISYKIVNGQIIINLKPIVDKVLDEQCIDKYNTQRFEMTIPFSTERQVSGNSISIGIDKKRYILRLKNLEIIPSKQQKIDYDNTHPHRWKIPQWLKFIESLFYDSYGFASLTISKGLSGKYRNRGESVGKFQRLKDKILNIDAFPTDCYSVVEYLRWVFTEKADKVDLTMGLICCNSMLESWIIYKKRKLKKEGSGEPKKRRKWDN